MATLTPGTTGHSRRSVGPRLQILSGYHLNEPNQPRWAANIDSELVVYSGQIVSKTAAGLVQRGVVQGANSAAARASQTSIAILFDDYSDEHVRASGRISGVPITAGINATVQTPWFNKAAGSDYGPGTFLIADGLTGNVFPLENNPSITASASAASDLSMVSPDTSVFRYPIVGIVDRPNQPQNVVSAGGHPWVTSASLTSGATDYLVNSNGASDASVTDVNAVRVLTFKVFFDMNNTASA